MQERFRLGVFSSASALTVNKALTMINEAAPAAEGQPNIFRWGRLTYTRSNTQAVQQAHIDAGGNEWDTVKPLAALVPKIGPLHRVLLIDDDAYKVRDLRKAWLLQRVRDGWLLPCSVCLRKKQ